MADVLQKVADDEMHRVMFFWPPRHGKSEEVSRLFSAYYLYRHPERFVGINSYAADLAYTLSRAARENYKAAGGATKSDADAVKQWETPQHGGLWAAGVGGPITGKGFHLGIIDDPLKNSEEAASLVIRGKQKDWYNSTFYTRAEPGAAIVVIQTRWHEDDLAGWLLEEERSGEMPEGWHIVNLPAIAETRDTDQFPITCTVEPDFRKDGEALCPERYPLERLKQICAKIGDYFFGSLFQQRPSPQTGSFFDTSWFKREAAAPALRSVPRIRYWDLAGAKPGQGDWTVGVLMFRDPQTGLFWIEDIERFQLPANERNIKIVETAKADKADHGNVKTFIEQAPGLAKEATDTLIRQLAGFTVEADAVHRDKVTRAEGYQAQARAGNLRIVEGPNVTAFLKVHSFFPYGTHDDDVDAASGAFNQITLPEVKPSKTVAVNPLSVLLS